MLTTKHLLLGLLMLGVLGMHGLAAVEGTPAGHHGTPVVVAAAPTADAGHAGHASDAGHDEGGAGALALCLALLLALAGTVRAGRRTTWVFLLDRQPRRAALPLPPALRDSAPVPRFTVMRC
jgi:hypothetical protein